MRVCVVAMYSNIGIEPNGTGGVSRFWLNDFDINLMHSCDQTFFTGCTLMLLVVQIQGDPFDRIIIPHI